MTLAVHFIPTRCIGGKVWEFGYQEDSIRRLVFKKKKKEKKENEDIRSQGKKYQRNKDGTFKFVAGIF